MEQLNVGWELTGLCTSLRLLVYQVSSLPLLKPVVLGQSLCWGVGFTLVSPTSRTGCGIVSTQVIFEWMMELIRFYQDAAYSFWNTHLDNKPLKLPHEEGSFSTKTYVQNDTFPQNLLMWVSPELRNPLLEPMSNLDKKECVGGWKV